MSSLDRSLTSLGGIAPEADDETAHTRAEPHHPPVLSAEQAAAIRDLKPFLRAVADVNRLAILQELGRDEGLTVLDLADRLVLSQPLTSWHLHILKRARLVQLTNYGRHHIYRLNRQKLREYKELFSSIVEEVASSE
jgi:DNA-binding transcriptional ArsR family regulator